MSLKKANFKAFPEQRRTLRPAVQEREVKVIALTSVDELIKRCS